MDHNEFILNNTKTKHVKNRYFVVLFVKNNIDGDFINSCEKIINNIIYLPNFKNILFQDIQHLCIVDGKGVDHEYIQKHLERSNFILCLMNHFDYSLAGFVYGKSNKPDKYKWSSLYVSVLCGHNYMKGIGYQFMNILKLIVIELNKINSNKNGFVLDSINNPNTLDFYDKQDILPIHSDNPFHRFWRFDRIEGLEESLQKNIQKSRIQLKIRGNEFEFISNEQSTPRTPRNNLLESLRSTTVEKKQEIKSKKIKEKINKKKRQTKELKRQLQIANEDLDSEDKYTLDEFLRDRSLWHLEEDRISKTDIKRMINQKTRKRFKDSQNYWDVLRISSEKE